MSEFRQEKDTMGIVEVPADKYWGAQTQRSKQNFDIGADTNKMPREIIYAFAYLKKAAALTNSELGALDAAKAKLHLGMSSQLVTHLKIVLMLPKIASRSKGRILNRLITSHETPFWAMISAASSATPTGLEKVIIVTSVPSRSNLAFPIGMTKSDD